MSQYLYIAVILVCFYDAIVMLMLPSTANLFLAGDGSMAEFVTILCALGIGLIGLVSGFKALPNKWIAGLILFIVFSSFHSPNISFESSFLPHDAGLFNYKPMFEMLVYFMMFMGIYSIYVSRETLSKLFKVLSLIAVIYAGYIILQRLGMDQIYRLATTQEIGQMSRNPQCGGFINQPVFAGAFIAILLPIVWTYAKRWQYVICSIGIICTGNRSAIITAFICCLFFNQSSKIYGKVLLGLYISYLILGTVLQFIPHHLTSVLLAEERFIIWKQVILDIIHPVFPGVNVSYILTGTGIGSFSVLFPFYNHNGYYQAHNEFLEALKCIGIVGLFLWIKALAGICSLNNTLLNALLAACILSMTNAIWHVPQLQFMTVLLIGLLYQERTHVLGKNVTA